MQMSVFFCAYLVIGLERKIVFRLNLFLRASGKYMVERCEFDLSQIKTNLSQIQALL